MRVKDATMFINIMELKDKFKRLSDAFVNGLVFLLRQNGSKEALELAKEIEEARL